MKPEPESLALFSASSQPASDTTEVNFINISRLTRGIKNCILALFAIAVLVPFMILWIVVIVISAIIKAGPNPLNMTKY